MSDSDSSFSSRVKNASRLSSPETNEESDDFWEGRRNQQQPKPPPSAETVRKERAEVKKFLVLQCLGSGIWARRSPSFMWDDKLKNPEEIYAVTKKDILPENGSF